MSSEATGLRDAFRGALLGTFVGDALGAPVEGWSATRIRRELGEVRDMKEGRRGKGVYTDDTQMMIALAEALLEDRELDPERLARHLASSYDGDRGYGRGTTDVFRRLRAGEPWESAAEGSMPRGSFGNGAAIRVAPAALLLHHSAEELERLAEDTALTTHPHPLGVAGCLLQARQVAAGVLLRGRTVDPVMVAVELRSAAVSLEFRQKLRTVEEFLEKGATPELVHDRLGCNSSALGSVPTALYCFLARAQSFEEAIVFAVNLGGDADSIAAMTGAIAGAYHGAHAIPRRWRIALEEGEKGAAYVEHLADGLLERHLELRRPRGSR
ncbi:MAG: hypothetical protein QOD06_3080 [Candidatus Binatota bacterium]|nr:hypothetical protein [Candidatus Binatota bacterium]